MRIFYLLIFELKIGLAKLCWKEALDDNYRHSVVWKASKVWFVDNETIYKYLQGGGTPKL